MEIECCNTGGKGKFRVLPGTASPSDEFMVCTGLCESKRQGSFLGLWLRYATSV